MSPTQFQNQNHQFSFSQDSKMGRDDTAKAYKHNPDPKFQIPNPIQQSCMMGQMKLFNANANAHVVSLCVYIC